MRSLRIRRLLASSVAMLLPGAAGAQVELRGRVVTDSGTPISGATITLASVGYSVRADSLGEFRIAGQPGSTLALSLRAAGYRADTATITLPRRSNLSRQFKLISDATALPETNPSDRVLRGYVTDSEGGPLAYATVQVNGGRRFIADDSGRFTIPSPAGRFWLLVRRIGFSPVEITLDAPPDTVIRMRMTAFATALPEQRITGRAAFVSLDLSGFYRRMKDAERGINHGYFVTPEDFEFRKPHLITQMAEGHPAVFLKRHIWDPKQDLIVGTPCLQAAAGVSHKGCTPIGLYLFRCVMTVYLDRIRIVSSEDHHVNELVVPSQIAAMEIYPRGVGAPPEFQPMNGSCGVVLIWSK